MNTSLSVATLDAALVPATATIRPKQNWVLDPLQDALFIIAAPLIALAFGLIAFAQLGAAAATSFVIVTHIILTVAHHLPTFIRIYGDVDLFKRFKWSFVLGPIVPLAFSTAVLVYLYVHDYPVEYFLYLYILLALWDPWHFLRQHYGFVRIYDRHNAVAPKIASRMDWWLCVTWFVFIMLASGAWLPDVLSDLYTSAQIPIVLSASIGAINTLEFIAGVAAFGMTLAYGVYLYQCHRRGLFISWPKVAMIAITFGVMYLTYTPNPWIAELAPGWTFKVGFAAVGIVHMTQYLAIVWRYNRTLADNSTRSRAGWFRALHRKRHWQLIAAAAALYVAICLAYGNVLTTKHDNRQLMSVLLALGFTSTLLHYYFDGFIWKIRHRQNREGLALASEDSSTNGGASWWQQAKLAGAGTMLLRQSLYFGLPMAILTVGAVAAWSLPRANYIEHMYGAQALSQQGNAAGAEREARIAYADMNRQLPFAAKMAELEPTSAHE